MTYTDPEELEQQTDETADETNDMRNLRRKAKERDRFAAEAEEGVAARRELAFIKAGVDTDTPIGKLFMRAYDGELDKESVTAAYAELGGMTTSDAELEQPPDPSVEATRERQALASGAATEDGEVPAVPVRGKDGRAVKAGKDALTAGAPRDQAAGVTFGELISAAAEGDRSVIIPFGGQEQP